MGSAASPLFRWFQYTARGLNATVNPRLVLEDLDSWHFDPDETGRLYAQRWPHAAPATLAQAFVASLPTDPVQASGPGALARDILRRLHDRGANLAVRGPHGERLEDLAPEWLQEDILSLRGGDNEAIWQMRRLRKLAANLFAADGARTLVHCHRDRPHPILSGAPAALGLALLHRQWAREPPPGLPGKGGQGSGPSSVARARAADLCRLAHWAKESLPEDLAQPALAIMEAVARVNWQRSPLSDSGPARHWRNCAKKIATIAGRPALAPGNLEPLAQALDGRFGPATPCVGLELSHALLTFPQFGDPDLWARSVAASLDPDSPWPVLVDAPHALPPANRALVLAMIRGNALVKSDAPAFRAWVDHLPAGPGLQLLAGVWAMSWTASNPAATGAQGARDAAARALSQAAGDAVAAWLKRHPDLAKSNAGLAWLDALLPDLSAQGLPEDARAQMAAWQMAAIMPATTVASRPRL